ncbi:MAG TPA: ABC transporter substrate-binding protein [Mycobacteriales bacterium]|nr:ABC transporter substrate-binding protein [Mycobacteriales bacterium]
MAKGPVRLLATATVVALGVAACGGSSSGGGGAGNGSSAPGVTADSILIGSTQPLTGIAAPGYSEIAPASAAYFTYVNAHGGINGRQINFKYLDDGYDPGKTTTDTKQLVLQDKVFAVFEGLGTPTHEAVVDFLNQQNVPDLFVASGCLCWNNPSEHPQTFGWLPDYTREGKILGDYVKKNFAGKKIGIFAQGDDFGDNGIKGFEQEVPANQIASIQRYDPTNIKIAPQVTKLKKAGVQVLVSFTVPAFTALLKLTSLQLQFSPQLVVSSVGSDPATLAGLITNFAKEGGTTVKGEDLIQGIITDGYLPSPSDPSNSWIKLFQKVYKKYLAKKYPVFDGNIEYGLASAYTFAEALAAAGENPTRESLVAAVEANKFAGPNLTPYAYSSDDHSGMTGVQMGVINGLAIKLQGTPMVTDDGSGGITPYTTAEATAPANGVPSG